MRVLERGAWHVQGIAGQGCGRRSFLGGGPRRGFWAAWACGMVSLVWSAEGHAFGGVSGSKLAVSDANTIPRKHLEFEPAVDYGFVSHRFDSEWNVRRSPRAETAALAFRFSLGVSNEVEVGFVVPIEAVRVQSLDGTVQGRTGFGLVPVGLKWSVGGWSFGKAAFLAGATLPLDGLGSGKEDEDRAVGLEAGGAVTLLPGGNGSLDTNVLFGFEMGGGATPGRWTGSLGLGWGYWVGAFQPVVEAALDFEGWETVAEVAVRAFLGFTYCVSDRLVIVSGWRVTAAGLNCDLDLGYDLAFTMTL